VLLNTTSVVLELLKCLWKVNEVCTCVDHIFTCLYQRASFMLFCDLSSGIALHIINKPNLKGEGGM
jgi:hypothetical protein